MNIRFDDSILQDFGDLCSTFFSSTPMFSIEPYFCYYAGIRILRVITAAIITLAVLRVIHSVAIAGKTA